MQAIRLIDKSKHTLILGIDEGNSYAAATEIKAYCNQNKIKSTLLSVREQELVGTLKMYHSFKNAIARIKTYKLGLIGEISEWLIASKVEGALLNEKLGISFEKVFWDHYPEYFHFENNINFIDHFKKSDEYDIADSSKVYNQINSIVNERSLDAISVECFPMVKKYSITSCLALSYMNEKGFPAGCEGDLTSIAGMIIIKELIGQLPWMANLISIAEDSVYFAHCTIATNLLSNYKVTTHFESDTGNAIQGDLKTETVTIFRLNRELNEAYISFGTVVSRPKSEKACRTQIEVKLPKQDIDSLRSNPLGNHHLIMPENKLEIIRFFCKMKNIQLIND